MLTKAIKAATPLLPNVLDSLVNGIFVSYMHLPASLLFNYLLLLSRNLDEFADEMTFSTGAPPLRLSRAFLPLIKKSQFKRIIFISFVLASLHITFLMAGLFNVQCLLRRQGRLAHKWAASRDAQVRLGHHSRDPPWMVADVARRGNQRLDGKIRATCRLRRRTLSRFLKRSSAHT